MTEHAYSLIYRRKLTVCGTKASGIGVPSYRVCGTNRVTEEADGIRSMPATFKKYLTFVRKWWIIMIASW